MINHNGQAAYLFAVLGGRHCYFVAVATDHRSVVILARSTCADGTMAHLVNEVMRTARDAGRPIDRGEAVCVVAQFAASRSRIDGDIDSGIETSKGSELDALLAATTCAINIATGQVPDISVTVSGTPPAAVGRVVGDES